MLKLITMALNIKFNVPLNVQLNSFKEDNDILTSESVTIKSDNIYERISICYNDTIDYVYLRNTGVIELGYGDNSISIKHKHKYADDIILTGFCLASIGIGTLSLPCYNQFIIFISRNFIVLGWICSIIGCYLKYSYKPNIKKYS
jgi:hypothetical protein